MTTGYTKPNANVWQERLVGPVTGVASAQSAKFKVFQKQVLNRVLATVQTAGTNAAAGFDIYVGTTSVGAITVGTETAGSSVSSGELDAAVANDDTIELRGKANSATFVGHFNFVMKPVHDAQEP